MFKEFKEFATRGNVLDMAVGIVIGAAFGKIITSFVGDILMPPIGMMLGHVDFASLFLNISGKVTPRWLKPRPPARPPSTTAFSSARFWIS